MISSIICDIAVTSTKENQPDPWATGARFIGTCSGTGCYVATHWMHCEVRGPSFQSPWGIKSLPALMLQPLSHAKRQLLRKPPDGFTNLRTPSDKLKHVWEKKKRIRHIVVPCMRQHFVKFRERFKSEKREKKGSHSTISYFLHLFASFCHVNRFSWHDMSKTISHRRHSAGAPSPFQRFFSCSGTPWSSASLSCNFCPSLKAFISTWLKPFRAASSWQATRCDEAGKVVVFTNLAYNLAIQDIKLRGSDFNLRLEAGEYWRLAKIWGTHFSFTPTQFTWLDVVNAPLLPGLAPFRTAEPQDRAWKPPEPGTLSYPWQTAQHGIWECVRRASLFQPYAASHVRSMNFEWNQQILENVEKVSKP